MAATPSNMIPLGTVAPDFDLMDTRTERFVSLSQVRSKRATVIMFICNHCPYVKHVLPELVRLDQDYTPKGVSLVAISSNDVEKYPEDSPEKMRELFEKVGFSFPYLYDETQEVAKAYAAACTPDFYIFDKDLKCVYRGQLDGSRPGNDVELTGADVRDALDSVLAGVAVRQEQKASMGCNIKWR